MARSDQGEPGGDAPGPLRWIGVALLLSVLGWSVSRALQSDAPTRPKAPAIKSITIQAARPPPPPPAPPPPPPPKVEPIEQPRMVEQTAVNEPEPRPEELKPADEPPAPLATGITGDGPPDAFGLSGNGNGRGGGGGGLGGGGPAASRWGWYAAKVQSAVGEALRRNPRTREAVLNERVRIWLDSGGRIARAKLADSTGDAALDRAIVESLTGMLLPEPPPPDMPAPMVLRLTARRP